MWKSSGLADVNIHIIVCMLNIIVSKYSRKTNRPNLFMLIFQVILAEELQLSNGRELFKTQHNKWKAQQADRDRQRAMFQTLELKKVMRENNVIEWYGCKRDTPRCFGSIVDETPQYLWEGKWTPPCCLGKCFLLC